FLAVRGGPGFGAPIVVVKSPWLMSLPAQWDNRFAAEPLAGWPLLEACHGPKSDGGRRAAGPGRDGGCPTPRHVQAESVRGLQLHPAERHARRLQYPESVRGLQLHPAERHARRLQYPESVRRV